MQFQGKKAPEKKYESEPYDEGVYGPLDNPTSLPYEATPDDAKTDTVRGSRSLLRNGPNAPPYSPMPQAPGTVSVEASDVLQRLQREANPLLNGELAQWRFEELLETVETLVPNFVDGKIELASRYANGSNGAPKNLDGAEYWYRSAALQGDARGQYYLGLFLLNDLPRKHPWWVVAAEKLSGLKFPTAGEIEACAWFFLASRQQGRRVEEVDAAQNMYGRMRQWFSKKAHYQALNLALQFQDEIDATR